MKKVFIILSLILSIAGVASVNASVSTTDASMSVSATTYEVKACANPSSSGVKIKGNFTVTWDGDVCYVVARDGKYFDTPILCSYSRTYPGYPFCFSYNNQTWYFSL